MGQPPTRFKAWLCVSMFFSFDEDKGKLFNVQKMLWRLLVDFRELQEFYDVDAPISGLAFGKK